MTDFSAVIASLKRPKLLIRAARIGAADYSRSRDLPAAQGRSGAGLLDWLLACEATQNAERLAQPALYDPVHHVRLLTALLAELRNFKPVQMAEASCAMRQLG